jgi:hypothetical protein
VKGWSYGVIHVREVSLFPLLMQGKYGVRHESELTVSIRPAWQAITSGKEMTGIEQVGAQSSLVIRLPCFPLNSTR